MIRPCTASGVRAYVYGSGLLFSGVLACHYWQDGNYDGLPENKKSDVTLQVAAGMHDLKDVFLSEVRAQAGLVGLLLSSKNAHCEDYF